MPYIGSNVGQKTTFDNAAAARQARQQSAQSFYQAQSGRAKTAQKGVAELRSSTQQRTQQRAANPIIPKMTTQQRNNERNQAAAQQRQERNAKIAQARNQG